MQKSSFKLYFFTLVVTLSLASFTFAGEGQCPLLDAPKTEGGRISSPVVNIPKPTESSSQFLKAFWDFITQSTDLF
jgi:hypothetical protein